MAPKRGLGRGFDSLIPTDLIQAEFDPTAPVTDQGRVSGDMILQVRPELVDPNPHQPRQDFNPDQLDSLASSIRLHGILQPLVLTRTGERFQLIAGERRLRAAKLAGLTTVPAIVRSFDEQEKLELALIENLQRADLNPIETATAFRKLVDQFNLKVGVIATRVGKDESTISNIMRLLNLPLAAKRALVEGKISEGMARTLLSLPEPERQLELLALAIKHNWNVRQAEEYARGLRGEGGSHERAQRRIAAVTDLTRGLADYLGTKVTQLTTAKGGRLVIEYTSEEELERIARVIEGGSKTD